MISLTIISGRSGSGKSTALHVLEDLGYYCIDNLPVSLLKPLIEKLSTSNSPSKISVSIDARNVAEDLAIFPSLIEDIKEVELQIVYLDSTSPTLVKRFSETRRKHPLSNETRDLSASLEYESELLDPIAAIADLSIDTTNLNIHDLRDLIGKRLTGRKPELALSFQSFAFKSGVPLEADLVFDVRCLPNPHWITNLRTLTGLDKPVANFLEEHDDVQSMENDIKEFLTSWLPKFEKTNRSYMTIAIGCTGGQHRSVYVCNKLFQHFQSQWSNVQIKHRELGNPGNRN